MTVAYTCRHGHEGTMSLADGARISGKLVWKVDWPMRWRHENVVFEPAGEDHHAPTGSFTVGRTLVRQVFGGEAPLSTVYSFVTLAGAGGKMSGSAGGAATPAAAMSVLEPAIVRWPYVQRTPNQSFAIDLSARAVQRQYDHWDQFAAQAQAADAKPESVTVLRLTIAPYTGTVNRPRRPVSFRLLAAAADITQANRQQIARIVAAHLSEPLPPDDVLLEELEPRLTCAIRYAMELVPLEQRTRVREEFSEEVWQSLDADARRAVALLRGGLREDWSLEGLTSLVYGVPKQMLGLPPDVEPSPALKRAQREFFKLVYRLLLHGETGPRLPTLLLSIGLERAERLLGRDATGGAADSPVASGEWKRAAR
jgi:lysyl-tRNA synthetase class 1